jgi:2,3-bisphosphoglycerate-independent phosphoglycerate mutase
MPKVNRPKPVVLISMDGVGVASPGPGNAVTLANTPNLDKYWPAYPHTYLEASGINVGLPNGIDGNSEVGHMAQGAGKIMFQDLPRIDNAINNDSFYQNPELKAAFNFAKKNNGNVHVIGIVGPGKVHGSLDHMYALIKFAGQMKLDPDKFLIHAITDGRDSPTDVAAEYLDRVSAECIRLRMGRIATIIGRYYAMDRDRRWERTQKAYELYTQGKGHVARDINIAMEESYTRGKTDEFVEPTIIVTQDNEEPVKMTGNDAVIFCNFRPDRAMQLTRAFVQNDFNGFEREKLPLFFVGMTQYEEGLAELEHVAFPPESMEKYLGRVLADNRIKQLRIAESEKFAHVTYFFNAGHQEVLPGETWVEIPSPKDVATYDQKPEMSQRQVTDELLKRMDTDVFDFILVNFAGPDMVAHTGVVDATVKAMEVCDECIGRIVDKTLEKGGAVLITADHGNAEEMIDLQTGEPDTKHSTNLVPVIIISKGLTTLELPVGNLGDIAPTILALMGIEKPAEMTGRNLLV